MESATQLKQAASGAELTSLHLTIVDGADAGRNVVIRAGLRVGSAAGNDVVLRDPTVSRVHVSLSPQREGVHVRDLGSTNGTFVDGVRVREAWLQAGSLLRLGDTTLRAERAADPIRLELAPYDRLGDLIGVSPAMRHVYSLIERAAPTSSTVLVQGETGTGKELVARAIHERSSRRGSRFLAIDCGALPETLIESELFGHVRGAFSGAVGDRAGAFEEAHGGTLFFDEVGELTAPMQRKLLRALESREIRRVGDNRERKVDVRVIAATHRPLATAANEGLFREDLYFRLAVVTIELPPLRARREDIPLIAQEFLDRLTGGVERVTPELTAALIGRSWSGNVRELRNYLEQRTALLKPMAPAVADELPAERDSLAHWVRFDLPFKDAQSALLDRFERAYLSALLERANGNVTHAAQVGGVSRRFLQRRMIELGLRDAEPGDA